MLSLRTVQETVALGVTGTGKFAFRDPEEGPEETVTQEGVVCSLGASEDFFLQDLNRILKDGRVLAKLKRKTTEGGYNSNTSTREPHGQTDRVLGS